MKRLVTLAAVATLLIAGSASAQLGHHAIAQPNATFAFGVGGAAAGPTTTNNDDSCDIGVTPAATLLLPYFEVETNGRATTTFFTVTNTSNLPQIAHVTVWTDWSFPVLDFNIFLTGYDVQPIDLFDIIVNGVIAPGLGTGGTGSSVSTNPNSPRGPLSALTNANLNVGNCANLPGGIVGGPTGPIVSAIRNALVTGVGFAASGFGCPSAANQVGSPASTHTTATTAVGYVTIDVAANCSTRLPDDPTYFQSDILFDNVLTGDYQIINKATGSNYAGGNPLVHIRAIPEGGPAATPLTGAQTNLPYTFYSRYINGVTVGVTPLPLNLDRRQPLPSTFAARWISGGPLALTTNFRIWREGVTGAAAGTGGVFTNVGATCTPFSANSALPIEESVRFDEHENFLVNTVVNAGISPFPIAQAATLPETSSFNQAATTGPGVGVFPPAAFTSGDTGGWMYLNLNAFVTNTGTPTALATAVGAANTALHPGIVRASQNWVIVAMAGAGSTAGQFGVDFDATWLGNGCSGFVPVSTANGGTNVIGPTGGVLVCPAGDPGCTPGVGAFTGTNVTP